eukprot:CAMPEP_0201989896 /NCGR_PEP_ID=MMETSP0904-20121228/93091_1 /ASSEMBLY_ACC=CAM_ASM_000553 /TAXON_ID=420261 /ORGANISM="Thalassiosira antarctica, Strain CCMP982" /LENGTH=444 /DNA_ID=CAMNT_0048544137 /DNA_START=21 /DNA_END=1355 /DNA_ORIENTATION=-
MFESDYRPATKKNDVVYFNSNRYLGQQFLSPDAMRAGYTLDTTDRPLPGESIIEFTEKKLFEGNPDQLIRQAERRLLHALAKFPQARAAMRTVYSTSTFGPSNMRWTSEEREWLFLCLTGSPEINPALPVEMLDGGTPSQLHLYLADRHDCPNDAFNRDLLASVTNHDTSSDDGIIDTTIESSDRPGYIVDVSGDEPGENSSVNPQVEVIRSEEEELDSFLKSSSHVETQGETAAEIGHINGLLDEYFLETDMFPSFTNSKIAQETRAELTVQETVATILRATAMKRFSNAKSKLTTIVYEMDRRLGDEGGNELTNNDFDDVSSDELQELFLKLGSETVDAQKSLYETERSTDRVNSHLLDYSVSNGVQSKQSQAELDRLDKMMEDHIASLPEDSHRPETRGDDGEYVYGSDEVGDGEIDPMFGGRNPDEYVVRGLPNGEGKFE